MEKNTLIRAFIAIEIPDVIKHNIKQFEVALQKNIDSRDIKWVNPDNIHLTIKFLGETDQMILQKIFNEISLISPSLNSPDLQIGDIGAFPNLFKPRILWVGCSKPKELVNIYKKVNQICSEYEFPVETRSFSPHFTIARLKGSPTSETIEKIRTNFNQSKNIVFGKYKVSSLIIYKSDLKPSGPVYTPLNKIDLS